MELINNRRGSRLCSSSHFSLMHGAPGVDERHAGRGRPNESKVGKRFIKRRMGFPCWNGHQGIEPCRQAGPVGSSGTRHEKLLAV